MIVPFRLELTDFASIRLSLNDNVQFANARFAPAVAERQRSALARGGPYLPVSQTITVDVLGDTPARCWANLAYLIELLDSADRWWNEDAPGSPLCLLVQTTRQSLAVSAVVLGYQESDQPLSVSDEIQTPAGPRYAILGVQFTVLRGGVWEADAETAVVSSLVTNPGVMSVTFPTANPQYSRVRLKGYYDGIQPIWMQTANPGVLILASDSSKIQIVDSAALTTVNGAATITTQTDTARYAVGGSVRRITAATGNTLLGGTLSFSALKRRVGIWAAVRNNSANTFYIKAEIADANHIPNTTLQTVIDASTTNPRIVYLGMLTARYDQTPAAEINLYITAASTNVGHTLDIDYLCLAALDDPWTDRALTIGPVPVNVLGTTFNYGADLLIEPGTSVLRTPYPLVEASIKAVTDPVITTSMAPYQGDPYIVAKGTTLAAIWLSTDSAFANWRINSLSTAQQLRISAQRARAYRVPPGAGES